MRTLTTFTLVCAAFISCESPKPLKVKEDSLVPSSGLGLPDMFVVPCVCSELDPPCECLDFMIASTPVGESHG
jgi:hypothetical protein